MKILCVVAMCLWMTGCVSMTSEQRAAFAQAYLQNQAAQPPRPQLQPYVMPTQQQTNTQTNCYSYVANQVQCQSTTTH